MMLKRIFTFRKTSGTTFLGTGSLSASKVISRTLSQKEDFKVVGKWDLFSAVCLERHSIITRPMQDLEARYQKMLQNIEFENSLLSDFEMRMKREKDLTGKVGKTEDEENTPLNQTSQDFQDSSEAELAAFQFAPRTSEAEDDMLVSLKRKLDKNLMLLVGQTTGNTTVWIPPQSIRNDRETMIQTAYRTLEESCGNNIKVKFYGNAPIGFYKYRYPKGMHEERDGAKVFYFLAKYMSGNILPNVKHCWLDRQELKDTVQPRIHKSLSQFLLPD